MIAPPAASGAWVTVAVNGPGRAPVATPAKLETSTPGLTWTNAVSIPATRSVKVAAAAVPAAASEIAVTALAAKTRTQRIVLPPFAGIQSVSPEYDAPCKRSNRVCPRASSDLEPSAGRCDRQQPPRNRLLACGGS